MTVGELIERLKEVPQSYPVTFLGSEVQSVFEGYREVSLGLDRDEDEEDSDPGDEE